MLRMIGEILNEFTINNGESNNSVYEFPHVYCSGNNLVKTNSIYQFKNNPNMIIKVY